LLKKQKNSMQKYLGALSIILLITMVIIRVMLLKKQGIKAMKFGAIDKRDFLIPPFALFYFYWVFANVFNLPGVSKEAIFHNETISWIGVFLCLLGLAFVFYSLASFKKSFRVGIDVNVVEELITTGVFAFSRNPMYVAFELVLFGEFLIFSSWILLVYMIAAIWLFRRQILLEEDFLKRHYGRAYMEYCKRVRRYI
jgi:protein-S-isoprenylcysteine O-methyltransferase Ste14